MKLTIDKTITDKVPSFNVIAYTMEVENAKTKLVDEYLAALSPEYFLSDNKLLIGKSFNFFLNNELALTPPPTAKNLTFGFNEI